ncbi:hypothetical protein V6N13_142377 [Hibiscus sabdariffa]
MFPIRVVAFEEAVGQQCDCCCGTVVESGANSEAVVSAGKNEQPLEVSEAGDTSRLEERLVDASMEGMVVPNTASYGVNFADHLDI